MMEYIKLRALLEYVASPEYVASDERCDRQHFDISTAPQPRRPDDARDDPSCTANKSPSPIHQSNPTYIFVGELNEASSLKTGIVP